MGTETGSCAGPQGHFTPQSQTRGGFLVPAACHALREQAPAKHGSAPGPGLLSPGHHAALICTLRGGIGRKSVPQGEPCTHGPAPEVNLGHHGTLGPRCGGTAAVGQAENRACPPVVRGRPATGGPPGEEGLGRRARKPGPRALPPRRCGCGSAWRSECAPCAARRFSEFTMSSMSMATAWSSFLSSMLPPPRSGPAPRGRSRRCLRCKWPPARRGRARESRRGRGRERALPRRRGAAGRCVSLTLPNTPLGPAPEGTARRKRF